MRRKKAVVATVEAAPTRGKSKVRVSRDCFFCRKPVMTDATTSDLLCDHCVARLSDPPAQPKPVVVVTVEEKAAKKEAKVAKKLAKLEAKKTATKGKGRGWHLRQLFEFDGTFYSFGKEIDDKQVARIRKQLKSKG
jgi:hypothetical protein